MNREVCQISTRGVRIASVQDNPYNSPFNPESAYLFCVYQKVSCAVCQVEIVNAYLTSEPKPSANNKFNTLFCFIFSDGC